MTSFDCECGESKHELRTRRRELDLTVNTAWTQQCRVENVDTVGGHDDLDVLGALESVELVEELKHGTLNFESPPPDRFRLAKNQYCRSRP